MSLHTVTLPFGWSATEAHGAGGPAKYRVPRWLSRCGLALRTAWLVCGVTLMLLIGLEAAYQAQSAIRRFFASATLDVSHPYAGQPWFATYQAEDEASQRMRWEPYVYWRRAPLSGRYVNVDTAGHRRTVQPAALPGPVRRVFCFGGSTLWGTGARDEMTIPSQLAAQLAERGVRDVVVTNFGEGGYVFTQEVLRLELELRRGSRPDVVVFLDGINDVVSTLINGRAGLPQNEANRVADFRLGRVLSSGNYLRVLAELGWQAVNHSKALRRIAASASRGDVSDAGLDTLARDLADTYVHTAELVEALSRRYGFRALYFWQPTIHESHKPLTGYEQWVRTWWPAPARWRLAAVHRAVAPMLDSLMANVAPGRFANLSAVFDNDTATVYLDVFGHTTEQANGVLAARMLDQVLEELRWGRPGQGQSDR